VELILLHNRYLTLNLSDGKYATFKLSKILGVFSSHDKGEKMN